MIIGALLSIGTLKTLSDCIAIFVGRQITPTIFFISFIHHRLAYMLPAIILLNNEFLNKIANWKIWFFPSLFICSYSTVTWIANSPKLNFQGFSWFWYAILEWMALFTICLFLYQKKTGNFKAFTLSFLSVYLGGLLYEIPFKAYTNQWSIFDAWFSYLIATAVFAVTLWSLKFKPTRLTLLTLIPLAIGWVVCIPIIYQFKQFGFLLRLSVFPLLIGIPYVLKKKWAKMSS
jgi:hypothetical protein